MDQSRFSLNQDISAYREYAKESRDLYERKSEAGSKYRSFAIIPDIVAIDIHATDFMSDKQQVNKLKSIIISEYPDLLTHGHSRR